MDSSGDNRGGGLRPWWVRAIVGALVGAIAATLLSIVVAVVGLALGLATWNRFAVGATGRMILAVYTVFILLGVWNLLVRPPESMRVRADGSDGRPATHQ